MRFPPRPSARSRSTFQAGRPGAAGSKGWGALGAAPTCQRLATAAAGALRAGCRTRQGVACAAAARLKRRAGVSPIASTHPITRASACDFKASSMAHSASALPAAETRMRRRGPRPAAAMPAPCTSPSSRRLAGVVQKKMARRGLSWASPARARTASRRAKEKAAARSRAADRPGTGGAGRISCTAQPSRPPPRWASSRCASPSVQAGRSDGRDAVAKAPARWRSISAILERSAASVAAPVLSSGTLSSRVLSPRERRGGAAGGNLPLLEGNGRPASRDADEDSRLDAERYALRRRASPSRRAGSGGSFASGDEAPESGVLGFA